MLLQVELDLVALFDQVAGALHDGQGRQAEEIDLEQAERLDDRHLELGDRFDRAESSELLVGRCSGT